MTLLVLNDWIQNVIKFNKWLRRIPVIVSLLSVGWLFFIARQKSIKICEVINHFSKISLRCFGQLHATNYAYQTTYYRQIWIKKLHLERFAFSSGFNSGFNSLTIKKQTTKLSSVNFKKMLSPSYIILRIQRPEGRLCRSIEPSHHDLRCLPIQLFSSLNS